MNSAQGQHKWNCPRGYAIGKLIDAFVAAAFADTSDLIEFNRQVWPRYRGYARQYFALPKENVFTSRHPLAAVVQAANSTIGRTYFNYYAALKSPRAANASYFALSYKAEDVALIIEDPGQAALVSKQSSMYDGTDKGYRCAHWIEDSAANSSGARIMSLHQLPASGYERSDDDIRVWACVSKAFLDYLGFENTRAITYSDLAITISRGDKQVVGVSPLFNFFVSVVLNKRSALVGELTESDVRRILRKQLVKECK